MLGSKLEDFPAAETRKRARQSSNAGGDYQPATSFSHDEKVRRGIAYMEKVDPAIEGQQGDNHTFTTMCRIVRGFDLSEAEALEVLQPWNRRCQPPWDEPDLIKNIRALCATAPNQLATFFPLI